MVHEFNVTAYLWFMDYSKVIYSVKWKKLNPFEDNKEKVRINKNIFTNFIWKPRWWNESYKQKLQMISGRQRLKFNYSSVKKKTEMIINLTPANTTEIFYFEAVDQFIYLGSVITNRGGTDAEVQRRLSIAHNWLTYLNKVWKGAAVSVGNKLKLL